jgi:hypothetical protein
MPLRSKYKLKDKKGAGRGIPTNLVLLNCKFKIKMQIKIQDGHSIQHSHKKKDQGWIL